MDRLHRAAVIAELADALRDKGSWCGETHLQKATYLLQEALAVPLGLEFILYKRGPFSFALRDELTAMRADGLLAVRPHQPPYGPSLDATEASRTLRARMPRAVEEHRPMTLFIADQFGPRTASELERLSTAYYVTRTDMPQGGKEARARRITELKPHVRLDQAEAALEEIAAIQDQARACRLEFRM